jgi:hypothetical protein
MASHDTVYERLVRWDEEPIIEDESDYIEYRELGKYLFFKYLEKV